MPRTFRQTHHEQNHTKKKFLFIRLYVAHIPAPPHPYMRIACMHMTKSVSFTSCLINNTVLCHSTLLCANFTPLCAPLRYFTPLCATLLYLGRPLACVYFLRHTVVRPSIRLAGCSKVKITCNF